MWYDLVVLGILLFFTLRGAQKGVIWQLAGIAGIILCVVFSQSISAAFGPYVNLQPPLNHWVVMFGAYLVFTFLSFGVGKMLNDWIEKAELEHFNSHLGALFGFLKGGVLVLVITFFSVTLSPAARDALKNSKTGFVAARIIDAVHPYIPERLHDALDEYIHQLDTPEMKEKYAHEGHTHAGDEVQLGDGTPLVNIPGSTFGNDLFNPKVNGAGGTIPTQTEVERFLGMLPNTFGNGLRDEVARIIRNTPPERQAEVMQQVAQAVSQTRSQDIPALQQQLAQGGINALRGLASNWLNSTMQPTPSGTSPIPATNSSYPNSTPANSSIPGSRSSIPSSAQPQPLSVVDRCLIDISSRYSSLPVVQTNIQRDIATKLTGLPIEVQEQVLLDWRYDLAPQPQERDPDIGTNNETPLETRIVRELGRRGIPINRLSLDLQNRLQGATVR